MTFITNVQEKSSLRVGTADEEIRVDEYILVADEEFWVGEPTQAEGVDIGSMTEAAGAAQPAGTLQVR